MQKIVVSLLFAISFYTATVAPTYAIFCSNCSTWVMQIDQLVNESISAASNPVTSLQQTLATINDNILIPMRDAMSLIVLMKSGDSVQNLVLGSLGADPLLVRNPEQYLKNKALGSVDLSLGSLAATKSMYGDSLLSSLVASSRYEYASHETKLRALTQSSIPSIVQRNACDDTMLTQLAMEDVTVAGQPLDQTAFRERKQYFYEKFCTKDPLQDRATAQSLEALRQARPNIGGWDSWLALTGGDNQYAAASRLQTEIAKQAALKVEQAKTDYVIGGGIKSLTECKRYAENDINGNLYGETSTPGCELEEIKQVSGVLASTYKEAIETPMKLIRDSFGTGAGSLIGTAFSTLNLLKGISSSLGSATDGSSGGGSNNTGSTVTASSPPAQDLVNNPQAKQTLSSPVMAQLSAHMDSIQKLETVDSNFLSTITTYQGQLDAMKSCFQSIDVPDSEAMSFYDSETRKNTELRNTINQELELVSTAKTLLATTTNRINSSNSSEEIASIFDSYQAASQGLPGLTAGASREGEYISFQGKVRMSSSEDGGVYRHKQRCDMLRIQMLNGGGA